MSRKLVKKNDDSGYEVGKKRTSTQFCIVFYKLIEAGHAIYNHV